MLRYVPYLKEEKEKIQRYVSALPQSFKDRIEFDEPNSLEDEIIKLNHCYEKFRYMPKYKVDWKVKGNAKFKGKRKKETKGTSTMLVNLKNKKRSNATRRGHYTQGEAKGYEKGPFKCCICGGNDLRKYFPQHKNIGPRLYNAHEVETVKDVPQNIPIIYIVVDYC